MKKHWKKIILVLGLILLSVAGYLVYAFQFKEYETADENVDKVVEEEYKVELPDGSVIIVDKEGNVVEGAKGDAAEGSAEGGTTAAGGSSSEGGTSTEEGSAGNASSSQAGASGESAASGNGSSATGSAAATASGTTASSSEGSAATTSGTASSSSNGSSAEKATGSNGSKGTTESATGGSGSAGNGTSGGGSTGSAPAGSAEGGVTVASIKGKYEPTLADIEGQATSRIGGLIGAAQTEYGQKKANGESINFAYFYNKYMDAATELETRTDTVFYAVIGSLKQELKANGLAESHAESFVSEYEARKQARKKELLSKASGF